MKRGNISRRQLAANFADCADAIKRNSKLEQRVFTLRRGRERGQVDLQGPEKDGENCSWKTGDCAGAKKIGVGASREWSQGARGETDMRRGNLATR